MDPERSPVRGYLMLRRVDPKRGMARYYALLIERDLFGRILLVRQWGRIGTRGQELAEVHESEEAAQDALDRIAEAKRRRGYVDL